LGSLWYEGNSTIFTGAIKTANAVLMQPDEVEFLQTLLAVTSFNAAFN
jgi:hypothetical protein